MFSCNVQTRISDYDPFAHVNNGAQCHLFDYGRSKYFEMILGKKIDWKAMDLVLVHIEIDFIAAITDDVDLTCDTAITDIGTKSMNMIQYLKDSKGKVYSTCRSTVVGIDRGSNKSIEIPEYYRAYYEMYEKE